MIYTTKGLLVITGTGLPQGSVPFRVKELGLKGLIVLTQLSTCRIREGFQRLGSPEWFAPSILSGALPLHEGVLRVLVHAPRWHARPCHACCETWSQASLSKGCRQAFVPLYSEEHVKGVNKIGLAPGEGSLHKAALERN